MKEETTKLLEQLAQKLGTTAEYLWEVLIRQAPISAATDLLYLILAIIGGLILFKYHKRFSKGEGEYKENMYDKSEGWLLLVMGTLTFVWAIIFIVCFFSIGNMINGFFNPEFWALREILQAAK